MIGFFFLAIVGVVWLIVVGLLFFKFIVAVGLTLEDWGKVDYEAAKIYLPALAGFIVAPFFLWRLVLTQQQSKAALKQAASAEAKLDIDRETQNTALYLKAVEMLGSMKEEKSTEKVGEKIETKTISKPDIEKRIGALFALERLARDSERDQPAILDMLCAYVRRNSGLDDYDKPFLKPEENESWPKPRQDIQTAVTVIGRRKEKWKREALLAGRIDLGDAMLMYISAVGGDFESANLIGANLQVASLFGANLQGAYLERANLQGAMLFQAKLQRANLKGANLQVAYLERANLQGALLFHAKLQRANLQGANLQRASLFGANLQGAYLQGAYLQGAYLEGAVITEVKTLTQDQIDSAEGHETTRLPSHITRPAHWSNPTQEGAEAPFPPADDIPF